MVYKYPIELPPGTNGMSPSLTLAYNSNGGIGMPGMGRGLSRIPVTVRDPSYGITFSDYPDNYI
ncbi:MAG: hypothetical protein ACM3X9_04035 [Bacillota bacterium]